MSMEFELSRLSVKYKSFHNLPQYMYRQNMQLCVVDEFKVYFHISTMR